MLYNGQYIPPMWRVHLADTLTVTLRNRLSRIDELAFPRSAARRSVLFLGPERASRIMDKLTDGAAAGGIPLIGAAVGKGAAAYPPTPAMKRFADSLVRQKGIKPPPGYKTSISICRKFLNEHAPKKADGETAGKLEPKPVSLAQLLYAKKIAQGKGLVIPEEAKASSAAMSAWIDSNRNSKRGRRSSWRQSR